MGGPGPASLPPSSVSAPQWISCVAPEDNSSSSLSTTETTSPPFCPVIPNPVVPSTTNSNLTRLLETLIYAEGICIKGEASWEWYLLNHEKYPGLTFALEQYGFKNPLQDPQGQIKAWAREVTRSGSTPEEKLHLLGQAAFKKISYLEAKNRNEKYSQPFTASQVFSLGAADCNEFAYFFFVAAKAIGLEAYFHVTLKWLQVGGGTPHMDLLVKIGKQTYRIEIETQKIKPIKADTEPASATVVFASYHLDRAAAYRRTSPNHPESIKEMRLAFSIDPNGEHTNLFLAGFNLRIKQYALAGTCFYRVTEINPRNTLALIGAGLVHAHFNEYVQARDLFSQAIEINPQYPIPYYLGWDLSTKDGDTQQAKEYLEWLVAINPFDILAVSLLAEIKLADQDYEGLKAFLSDSETGFDLTNFIVDFYKGLAYYQTGEPGKAKEKLESSLANSSTIVFSSSVMLGELALKKRDFPKAAQHFQVAITLKPDFCPGYLSLAQTYRAQGKPREAQKMEQQAARCGKQ